MPKFNLSMNKDLRTQLEDLSNDQLIDALKKLQISIKGNAGIAFGKAILELPPFQTGNERLQSANHATLSRHVNAIRGLKNTTAVAHARGYIIRVIELCCGKWNLERRPGGDFVATKTGAAELFRYEGDYYLYCLTSKEDAINKYPLHIDHQGNARMALHGYTYENSKDIIHGVAYYDQDSALSISFHKEGKKEKYRHYLFSVMNYFPPNNFTHAYGISMRTNHLKRPVARTEILVCSQDQFEDTKTVFKEYKIDSPEFRREDVAMKGFLNWLSGKYNRLVTAPATPNEPWSMRIEEEYVNVHFNSACYLAIKGESKECLTNLYQAYLHGYNNIVRLKAEIEPGGCLAGIYHSELKGRPRFSTISHEELSCRELVERIELRAKHIRLLPVHMKDV